VLLQKKSLRVFGRPQRRKTVNLKLFQIICYWQFRIFGFKKKGYNTKTKRKAKTRLKEGLEK